MENTPKYTCETDTAQPVNNAEKRVADFVEQNKDSYIALMTEKVNLAASKGEFSATISNSCDPRFFDMVLATMETAGKHFAESGFAAWLDSGENSGNDAKGVWQEATYCWAQLNVEWPEIEQTDGSAL